MKTLAFLGGDRRMACLAQLMARDGHTVRTWGLADGPTPVPLAEAAQAERIILPLPLAKEEGKLNAAEDIFLRDLWPLLRTDRRIYAGAVRPEDRTQAELRGLALRDYFTDEALAVRNAVTTAEGAVAAAMERMRVTLAGAPCLVLGFGRIGKLLAHKLRAMGACVSAAARRPEALAWIEAFGDTPLPIGRLSGRLGSFRAVFNTVPAPVLPAALMRELRPDCVLIELASRDGIDAAAAKELDMSYVKESGLPGRFAPESAALALRTTLYQIWEEET